MKINWKVRIKSPQFWIGIIGVILSPVMSYLGLSGSDFTTWESVIGFFRAFISNPYLIATAAMSVLSFLGVMADPTTSGFSDSSRAMTYKQPNKD